MNENTNEDESARYPTVKLLHPSKLFKMATNGLFDEIGPNTTSIKVLNDWIEKNDVSKKTKDETPHDHVHPDVKDRDDTWRIHSWSKKTTETHPFVTNEIKDFMDDRNDIDTLRDENTRIKDEIKQIKMILSDEHVSANCPGCGTFISTRSRECPICTKKFRTKAPIYLDIMSTSFLLYAILGTVIRICVLSTMSIKYGYYDSYYDTTNPFVLYASIVFSLVIGIVLHEIYQTRAKSNFLSFLKEHEKMDEKKRKINEKMEKLARKIEKM